MMSPLRPISSNFPPLSLRLFPLKDLSYSWGTQALTFSHPELRRNVSACIKSVCFEQGMGCSDMAIHYCFNEKELRDKYTPSAVVQHPVLSLVQHGGFVSATFTSTATVNTRWHMSEVRLLFIIFLLFLFFFFNIHILFFFQ